MFRRENVKALLYADTMTTDSAARTRPSWVIAFANQKGGVGKTTLALACAAATAAAHGRALVVDVDPQHSATDISEMMQAPGYDFVHEGDPNTIAKLRMVKNYDTIYVDCPGSLEGQDVLRQVIEHADYIIIPYDHDVYSMVPTIRTARYVEQFGTPYKVLLNRISSSGGASLVEDAWEALKKENIPYFRSFIRQYKDYSNSVRDGKTVMQYRSRYASTIRDDVSRANTELLYNLK